MSNVNVLKAAIICTSTEDNCWHYVFASLDGTPIELKRRRRKGLTLCGLRVDKRMEITPTASQEVMERLTGRDTLKCDRCEEIAKRERVWRQSDIGAQFKLQ